jgi:hypothetical protein
MFAKKRPLTYSSHSLEPLILFTSIRTGPTIVSLVRVLNALSACAVNSPFVEA